MWPTMTLQGHTKVTEYLTHIWCRLDIKCQWEAYRKPYLYYTMAASDVTYDVLERSHKGHGIFKGPFARKRCRLDTGCKWEAHRKPYLYYTMATSDVTYDDLARSHKVCSSQADLTLCFNGNHIGNHTSTLQWHHQMGSTLTLQS